MPFWFVKAYSQSSKQIKCKSKTHSNLSRWLLMKPEEKKFDLLFFYCLRNAPKKKRSEFGSFKKCSLVCLFCLSSFLFICINTFRLCLIRKLSLTTVYLGLVWIDLKKKYHLSTIVQYKCNILLKYLDWF